MEESRVEKLKSLI